MDAAVAELERNSASGIRTRFSVVPADDVPGWWRIFDRETQACLSRLHATRQAALTGIRSQLVAYCEHCLCDVPLNVRALSHVVGPLVGPPEKRRRQVTVTVRCSICGESMAGSLTQSN